MSSVEITESGRGGSIYYHEGPNTVSFGWEFGLSPALALIFGPQAAGWDAGYPWAAGRQEEIFHCVAREVIRQKAGGCRYAMDLETGGIDILQERAPRDPRREGRSRRARSPGPPKQSAAFERFMASVLPAWENWPEDRTYDLTAILGMTDAERSELVELLTARDVTWREVEALALIDTPSARAAVDAASRDHLSIDTRVVAAEVMHRQGRLDDLESVLSRQIRRLDRPANGLRRTLALAERHAGEAVRQALLWASYNQTDCAPACAELLLRLTGAESKLTVDARQRLLARLGLHHSYFERSAAFQELSDVVGMVLDPSQGD